MFGDVNLKNFLDTTLLALNLVEDSIIRADVTNGDISVTVKFLTGKVVTMSMSSFSTIEDFLQRLQDREGVPPSMARPVFRGTRLDVLNSRTTFQELGIVDGSVINVVLNLRG
jgi:hypothetical protein